MLNRIKNIFIGKKKPKKMAKKPIGVFSTDILPSSHSSKRRSFENSLAKSFQRDGSEFIAKHENIAMDASIPFNNSIKFSNYGVIQEAQINWYASQSFIGYQLCALLSQHWLVSKACTMPAKDAIRKGFKITSNEGEEIDLEQLNEIRKLDVQYRLNENLLQFVRMGRIFGIRIAMFKIDSDDPDYYSKPFNIDGVTPGSYQGISQIDPYWCAPELDSAAAADPSSIHFYEPTWWLIHGKRVHRTHLIIMRTEEVPDILKPTYFYGGVPIPQKIYERVYAAERTANEAPQLALTKRSTIIHTDLTQALAQQGAFESRITQWSYFRDNYGIKILGENETAEQFDTSLADLDAVIMTQYQIVAAAANVPAVKLLGTSPKGFNATGEFEEANYHEELESIQTHDLTPLIQRHHLLLIKSEIAPKFAVEPFFTEVVWESLDSLTAREQAEINKIKADTDALNVQNGIIQPSDALKRIINDPTSGYDGIDVDEVESSPDESYIDTEENEEENNPF